jgi:ubiquinone/menaquinone biosynthesis C-methylase UbiE
MKDYINESRTFYREFFSEERELSYDNRQRYEIVFSLIGSLSLDQDINILDIGAGSGRISRFLNSRFDSVIALDIVVASSLEDAGNECEFPIVEGTLPHLPFENGYFDLVVCSEVIEHIPNQRNQLEAISEIQRVTATEGYMILSTPNPRSPFYRIRNLIKSFGKCIGMVEDDEEGQLVESWVSPKTLRRTIKSEFRLIEYRGSYYVVPDFGIGWKHYFHPVSDKISELNLAPSYGLYQYYIAQPK